MTGDNEYSDELNKILANIGKSRKGADSLFTASDQELIEAFLKTEDGKRLHEEQKNMKK
jgi:hypothetical protein